MGYSILKHFDYFGVQFNFTYLSKEKFRTSIGGIGFLLFLLIALAYSFVNLIPLLKREKMSVIYYLMQLSQTDEINFKIYSNNFALGVSQCEKIKDNISEFWDHFKLEMEHINLIKEENQTKKVETEIPFGKCEYSDLDNKFNDVFHTLGLDSYYCMKDTDFTIEGTSTSLNEKYIKISLKAKNKDSSTVERIQEILKDECDLNMYVVDTAFNLSNFDEPIQNFLSSQFVNIKFSEMAKRNAYFQLQTFGSYENYFFDFQKSQSVIGAGSVDLYTVFKGNERFSSDIEDYDTFIKIYVRAELQRKIVERRYMKLTEFAADISSILSAVLICMFVVLSFVNKFYANESVMKKIFQFNRDFKNEDDTSKKDANHTFLFLLNKFNFKDEAYEK